MAKFQTKILAQHASGDPKPPLAAGIHIDLGDIPIDDDVDEVRLKRIRDAILEAKLEKPVFVIDIAPYDALEAEYPEGDAPKVADPKKISHMIVSAKHIADVSHVWPPNFRLGIIGGQRSVIVVNSAVPEFLWFRAANLQMADAGDLRVIPFPLVQPAQVDEEGVELEKSKIVYRPIVVNPQEFIEWSRAMQEAVQKHGLREGYAFASRMGYLALQNRIQFEKDKKKLEAVAWNEKRAKERAGIDEAYAKATAAGVILTKPKIEDDVPIPDTTVTQDDLNDENVERWTSDFIIDGNSSFLRGVLVTGAEDADWQDEKNLAIFYGIFH